METEEIKTISDQITQLQNTVDVVGNSASWGVILAGIALVLFVITLILIFLSRKKSQAQGKIGDGIREYLAIGIVIVGICIVGILGLVAMATGDEHFRREALAGILPLIGAWVGAVIAYYFGKENFQAASDSTAKLLSREERLAVTAVSKVMIPIGQVKGIFLVNDIQEAKGKDVKLLADSMKFNRAPVLTNSKFPLLIIHKSTLHEYLAMDGKNQTHKLENIDIEANHLWKKFESFGVVSPNATAAEVKLAIQNVGPDCSDVYVTKDGNKLSEVVGWVTNVDLLKAEYL